MPNERIVMEDYLAGWQTEKKPMRPGARSRSLRSTSPGTPICESGIDILLYWEVKRLQIAKSVKAYPLPILSPSKLMNYGCSFLTMLYMA